MKRCLPIFLLLLSVNAHGALNQWVDASGKVHYSDEPPPPDVQTTRTLTAPVAASGTPAQKTIAERERERKKAQKAGEDAAQRAAEQQEKMLSQQKYCEALRANLSILQRNTPLYSRNEKGENIILDDAARQQEIESIRTKISAGCN